MKRCAGGSAPGTRPRSTCSWGAIRVARIDWRGRSSATPRTRVTCPRRRSCGSSARPAASAGTRASRRGSIASSSICLCLDHRRRGRWWPRLLRRHDDPDDGAEGLLERQAAPLLDPGDTLGREQTLTTLWAAVDRLSPQQRAAIVLSVQEELSTGQIAAVLKCSEATVRVHLHRALMALRKTMRKD
jgi:DNA-directed RNA polymerase specialized sigma24 family protein